MTGRETPESADSDLARLEEEYQVYRNLAAGARVPATVTDVGVTSTDRVLVELSPVEDTAFVVDFDIDPEGLAALRRLHAAVGRSLTPDLDRLVGDTVAISFASPRLRRLSVPEADLSGRLVERGTGVDQRRLRRHLPERYVVALRRVETYESDGEGDVDPTPTRVPIRDVASGPDTLRLVLDLCGESWTGPVEVPAPDSIDGTPYERVVEEVGHGSVTQVADGVMYAVRAADTRDEPRDTFGSVSDAFSEWLLFTDRDAARSALPVETTEDDATRTATVARMLSVPPRPFAAVLLAGAALILVGLAGSFSGGPVAPGLWSAVAAVLVGGAAVVSARALVP